MAKRRLPPPSDCPEYVYEIMREGWDESPDKRFSPQALIAKLMGASMYSNSNSNEVYFHSKIYINLNHFHRSNAWSLTLLQYNVTKLPK